MSISDRYTDVLSKYQDKINSLSTNMLDKEFDIAGAMDGTMIDTLDGDSYKILGDDGNIYDIRLATSQNSYQSDAPELTKDWKTTTGLQDTQSNFYKRLQGPDVASKINVSQSNLTDDQFQNYGMYVQNSMVDRINGVENIAPYDANTLYTHKSSEGTRVKFTVGELDSTGKRHVGNIFNPNLQNPSIASWFDTSPLNTKQQVEIDKFALKDATITDDLKNDISFLGLSEKIDKVESSFIQSKTRFITEVLPDSVIEYLDEGRKEQGLTPYSQLRTSSANKTNADIEAGLNKEYEKQFQSNMQSAYEDVQNGNYTSAFAKYLYNAPDILADSAVQTLAGTAAAVGAATVGAPASIAAAIGIMAGAGDMTLSARQQYLENNNKEMSLEDTATIFALYAAGQGVGAVTGGLAVRGMFGKLLSKETLDGIITNTFGQGVAKGLASTTGKAVTSTGVGGVSEFGQEFYETGVEEYFTQDEKNKQTFLQIMGSDKTLAGGIAGAAAGTTLAGAGNVPAVAVNTLQNPVQTIQTKVSNKISEAKNKVTQDTTTNERSQQWVESTNQINPTLSTMDNTQLADTITKLDNGFNNEQGNLSIQAQQAYKDTRAKAILQLSETSPNEDILGKYNTNREALIADIYRNAPKGQALSKTIDNVVNDLNIPDTQKKALKTSLTAEAVNLEVRYGITPDNKTSFGYYNYIDTIEQANLDLQDNPDNTQAKESLEKATTKLTTLYKGQQNKLDTIIDGINDLATNTSKRNTKISRKNPGGSLFEFTLHRSDLLKSSPENKTGTYGLINSIIEDINTMTSITQGDNTELYNKLNTAIATLRGDTSSISTTSVAPKSINTIPEKQPTISGTKSSQNQISEPKNKNVTTRSSSRKKALRKPSKAEISTQEVTSTFSKPVSQLFDELLKGKTIDATPKQLASLYSRLSKVKTPTSAVKKVMKNIEAIGKAKQKSKPKKNIQPQKTSKVNVPEQQSIKTDTLLTSSNTETVTESSTFLTSVIQKVQTSYNKFNNMFVKYIDAVNNKVIKVAGQKSTADAITNAIDNYKEALSQTQKKIKYIKERQQYLVDANNYRTRLMDELQDKALATLLNDLETNMKGLDVESLINNINLDTIKLDKEGLRIKQQYLQSLKDTVKVETQLAEAMSSIKSLEVARRLPSLLQTKHLPTAVNIHTAVKVGQADSLLSVFPIRDNSLDEDMQALGFKAQAGAKQLNSIKTQLQKVLAVFNSNVSDTKRNEIIKSAMTTSGPAYHILFDRQSVKNSTGVWEELYTLNNNAVLAMDYSISDLVTNSSNTFALSKDALEIKRRENSEEFPASVTTYLRYGLPIKYIADKLGRDILTKLGYSPADDRVIGDYEKIASNMGTIALGYAAEVGIVEINPIEYTEGVKTPLVKLIANQTKIGGNTQQQNLKAKYNRYSNLLNLVPTYIKGPVFTKPKPIKSLGVRHMWSSFVAPKAIVEVINKLQQQRHTINTKATDLIIQNKDITLKYMGYVTEKELKNKSYEEFLSITGGEKQFDDDNNLDLSKIDTSLGSNGAILKEYETLVQMKQLGITDGFYFKYFYGKNGRLYLDSNTINPQGNKQLHRFLVPPEGFEIDFDMNDEGLIASQNFAISQAFDVVASDAEMKRFTDQFLTIPYKKLEEAYSKGTLKELGKEYDIDLGHMETVGQVILAINHAQAYQTALQQGKTTFKTSLAGETDATTSGYAIRLWQIPPNLTQKDAKEFAKILSTYGYKIGKDGELTVHGLKAEDKTFLDKYQQAASEFESTRDFVQIKPKENSSGKPYILRDSRLTYQVQGQEIDTKKFLSVGLMTYLHTQLQNHFNYKLNSIPSLLPDAVNSEGKRTITSALRKLAKSVVMVYGYGAGKYKMAGEVVKDISTGLINNYLTQNKDLTKQQLQEVNNLFNSIVPLLVDKDTDIKTQILNKSLFDIKLVIPLNTQQGHSVETSLQEYFDVMFRESYGNALVDSLNVQHHEDNQFNSVLNSTYGMIGTIAEKVINNVLSKLPKKKGTRNKQEYSYTIGKEIQPTVTQYNTVLGKNQSLLPLLPSPLAQLFQENIPAKEGVNNPDTDIENNINSMLVSENTFADYSKNSNQLGINISLNPNSKAAQSYGVNSLYAPPLVKTIGASFTQASVYGTHFNDGSILTLTLLNILAQNNPVIGVHDAIVSPLNKLRGNAQAYNNAIGIVNTAHSSFESAQKVSNNFLSTLLDISVEQSQELNTRIMSVQAEFMEEEVTKFLKEKRKTLTDDRKQAISLLVEPVDIKDPDEVLVSTLPFTFLTVPNTSGKYIATNPLAIFATLQMIATEVHKRRVMFGQLIQDNGISIANMDAPTGSAYYFNNQDFKQFGQQLIQENNTDNQDIITKFNNAPLEEETINKDSLELISDALTSAEDKIQIAEFLEHNSVDKTDPTHFNDLKELLGKIGGPIFKTMEVFFGEAIQSSINLGEYIPADNKILIAKKDIVNNNHVSVRDASPAQIYTHEMIHAVIHPLMYAKETIGKSKEYRQLVAAWNRAQKVITWEDFLTTDTYTEQDKIDAEAYYNHIFNNRTPQESLSEFVAVGLTHPKIKNKLQQIKFKDSVKDTLFSRLVLFFNKVFDVITGDGTFKELFNAMSNVFTGKAKYNDINKNMYDIVYAVVTNINKVNKKQESHFYKGLDLLKQAYNISMAFTRKGDDKFRPIIKKFLNSSTETKFLSKDLTVFNLPIQLYRAIKIIMTSPLKREGIRAFGKLLDEVPGFHPAGTIRTFVGDILTKGDFSYMLEKISNLGQRIEMERASTESATLELLSEAFDKPLSKSQAKAIAKVLLYTDISTLLNKRNSKEILELVNNTEKRQQEIQRLKQKITKAIVNNDDSNELLTLSDLLAHHMNTGEGIEYMAFSASGILKLLKIQNTSIVSDLDTYISLLALDSVDSSFIQELSSLSEEGLTTFLQGHEAYKNELKLTEDNIKDYDLLKGFHRTYHNSPYSTVIGPNDKIGSKYTKIGNLSSNSKYGLYEDRSSPKLNRDGASFVNYGSYGIGTVAKELNNYTLSMSEEFMDNSEESKELIQKTADIQRNLIRQGKLNISNMKKYSQGFVPVKQYTPNKVYTLNLSHKDAEQYLDKNTNALETLAKMKGNLVLKKHGKHINNKVWEAILDNMQTHLNGYDSIPLGWIALEENSKDPFIKKHFNSLPASIKKRIADSDIPIIVPKTTLLQLFGVKSSTIVDVKGLRNANYNIKKVIVLIERLWKMIASLMKLNIVVKTPAVVFTNIVSNLMLAKLMGMSPITVLNRYFKTFKDTREYMLQTKEFDKLSFKVKSRKATKEETIRLNTLQHSITSNPVHELMIRGFYQNIVEDISIGQSEAVEQLGQFIVDKSPIQIPRPIRWTTRQLFMSRGTAPFNTLQAAVQYSDFVARQVEYEIKMEKFDEKNKGKKNPDNRVEFKEKVMKEILENYINYNRPTSTLAQYLSDIGILNFIKYPLRIQSVIWKHGLTSPITMATFLGAQFMFADIPDPTDTFVIGNDPSKYVYNPIDTLFTAITPQSIEIADDYFI